MKPRSELLLFFALVLAFTPLTQAQAPTSRQVPFNNLASTLPGCTPAPCTQPASVDVQLWDDPISTLPVNLILSEPHRGTSPGSAVLDDAGNLTFLLGSQLPTGLSPDQFTSGSSRFVDVVDPTTGASVLTGSRIPLNAVAFALNPGPQGPQGPQGVQGPTGPPGPPGVVQTVTSSDGSITVGGTAADRFLSIASNGVTNAHVANGALSPAKIAGTAATLGPNNFVGNQNISGGTVTASNSNGVALDGIGSIVGVRGSAGGNGFGIVGSAPANGTAGQFNGSVNVTGPLSAGSITTSGNVNAASFSGPITTTSLNCTGCVKNTQLGVNYAGSASQSGPATNSLALGGVAASGYAPAFGSPNYVAKSGDSMNGGLSVGGNLGTNGNLRVEGGVSASSAGLFDVDAPFVAGGRLRVAVNGNVGIGTASPSRKLDVVGDASVSGTLSAGVLDIGLEYITHQGNVIAPQFTDDVIVTCPTGKLALGAAISVAVPTAQYSVTGNNPSNVFGQPLGSQWIVTVRNDSLIPPIPFAVSVTVPCARVK